MFPAEQPVHCWANGFFSQEYPGIFGKSEAQKMNALFKTMTLLFFYFICWSISGLCELSRQEFL